MTPWGIRNRLKSILGKAPSASTQVGLRITLPDGQEKEVHCEEGYSLVMASQSLETPIATGCPDGHCGECLVDVLDGSGLKAASPAEQKILDDKKLPANTRLACHARVNGSGARIKVHRVWTMDQVRGT